MKSKRVDLRKWVAAGLVTFMLLGGMGACGGGGGESSPPPPSPSPSPSPLADESFYGSLLNVAITGLVKGAGQSFGSDAMGQILQLLGWGSGSSDQAVLDAMNQKLDQIINTLNVIESQLNQLETQLQITTDEILANANDPTTAISEISTFQSELTNLSTTNTVGTVNQSIILNNYANQFEASFKVDVDVTIIHDAMIPPTTVKVPVLDNFVNLCTLRISPAVALTDCYQGLELYFSQLIYNQIKGVNIAVESKVAQEKGGLVPVGTAKAYMADFQANVLQPEVATFQAAVRKLILNQGDLINTATFLPPDTAAIVARADFLAIQLLTQDHFGLRANLIATQDLVSSPITLTAKNQATGQSYPGNGTMATAYGPAYDSWNGNQVSSNNAYNVVSYDFGPVPNGNYNIVDQSGNVLATAQVQTYTTDYVVSDSGTVNYGNAVFAKRVGAKDAFNNNANWIWWTNSLHNTGANGNASVKWTGLEGSAQNDSYSGTDELDAHFLYNNSRSLPITIHYAAHAYGTTYSDANSAAGGSAESKIYYRIGLWDATTNQQVNQFYTNQVSTGGTGKNALGDLPNSSFVFPNPSPGHDYYLYFYCTINGDSQYGDAGGQITIDGIVGNVYVTF